MKVFNRRMITKLLLQEKVTDINVKLDELQQEAKVSLQSFKDYNERIRLELQHYDLETDDQAEITRINKILDECYEDLRDAKSSLYLVSMHVKRKNIRGGMR